MTVQQRITQLTDKFQRDGRNEAQARADACRWVDENLGAAREAWELPLSSRWECGAGCGWHTSLRNVSDCPKCGAALA